MFHQFQNGYTLLKNGWYTEGTARWSEHALRRGVGKAGVLPRTETEVEELFKLRCGASRFWNAVAQAADPEGKLDVPESCRGVTHDGTNEPVIEDDRLHGAAFLKALLEELDRADDVVSRHEALDPLNWPESRQTSTENDERIWAAVLGVCRQQCADSTQPVRQMIEALSQAR